MVARYLKTVLISLFLLASVPVQAADLRVVPDRTRVVLGESFTLELQATGSIDGKPDLDVLEQDFEVLGRSRSSQIQVVNGEITRTASWRIALLARSAGSKLIPPLCIDSDCSEPVAIDVLPAGQQSATGGGELLLEVSAEPEQIRVQAQLLYKVRLLTRLGIVQAGLSDPQPSGVEAVVQKLGEDRQYEIHRDGLRYRVIERLYAIFPQQSGRLTIPPLQFDAQVTDGRGSNYPFNQRVRQLRKRSEQVSLEVLPAEQTDGRPWLPAGDLQLEDDWQQTPPQLTVGEPATRTLTLRAAGLPVAQLPQLELSIPDGFKSYPDQPSREDQVGSAGITGVLQQKLALVPTRSGRFTLPEISVDWWDVQAERWRQARLPEVVLEVLPGGGQAEVTPPSVQPTPPFAETEPLSPRQATAVADPGFWPWLSLVLGSGWLLTVLLMLGLLRSRRRREKVSPVEQESRPSLKNARRDLFRKINEGRPEQLRTALLAWGQALYPEAGPENLEQLAVLCGEPLAQQLEDVNRRLYSRSAGTWDGSALQAAVEQAERDQATKKQIGLPPLYSD